MELYCQVLELKKELRRLKCLPVRIQYLSKYQLIEEKFPREQLTLVELSAESIKVKFFNREPIIFTNMAPVLAELRNLPDSLGLESTHKILKTLAIPPYPVQELQRQSKIHKASL